MSYKSSSDRRQNKRYLNWMRKIAAYGKYGIGCRGHPGVVVETYYHKGFSYGEDFVLKSLVDDVEENCSLWHCGLSPLSKDDAIEQAAYYKKYGSKLFIMRYAHPEGGYNLWVTLHNDLKPEDYGYGKSLQEFMNLNDEEFEMFSNKSWPVQ